MLSGASVSSSYSRAYARYTLSLLRLYYGSTEALLRLFWGGLPHTVAPTQGILSRILLYMCLHTRWVLILLYVSSYYHICVLILIYVCPHTTIHVSSYYYTCVLILLYMCPHTTMSSYYYIEMWRKREGSCGSRPLRAYSSRPLRGYSSRPLKGRLQ